MEYRMRGSNPESEKFSCLRQFVMRDLLADPLLKIIHPWWERVYSFAPIHSDCLLSPSRSPTYRHWASFLGSAGKYPQNRPHSDCSVMASRALFCKIERKSTIPKGVSVRIICETKRSTVRIASAHESTYHLAVVITDTRRSSIWESLDWLLSEARIVKGSTECHHD